ncbi:Wzz/FepE/Etk N-terminal domain-containing protein [Maritalea sp.]|uniref:Wzz/FepE/Etk N-terminal domain-containing protein n=1 Tax=Maritalea sp. TaxID=2003361 RepID=UPI003EF0E545
MTQNGAKSYEDVQLNIHQLFGAIWRALPRIVIITAILCALTFVITSLMTKEYTSNASVLLEPRSDSFAQSSGARTNPTNQSAVDNAAIASQIQLLKSRETLLRVVDDLDLRSNPEFLGKGAGPLDLVFALFSIGGSNADAPSSSLDNKIIAKISSKLVAAQARDSRVISIKFSSTDPKIAADVANALAKALVNRRSDLAISDTSDATKWLDQEIKSLGIDVVNAENRVANFRVENDLFRSTRDTTLIGQQLSDLSRQISTVSERKNSAATRSRLIRNLLRGGQSLESVPDVRQSPVIQRMSQQKANFQASRAQSAATLLSNHPTLQALDAQIVDIDQQIQREGRRIAESLDTQAQIEGELEKSLRDDLVRLKLTASGAERSGVTLAELEREASAKRNLLNTFLARQSEATARTNTGAIFPDVRIISTASAPSKPSWPNKPLLLILVASISVVLQLGMVIISELAAGNVITVRHELEDDELQQAEYAQAAPIVAQPQTEQAQAAQSHVEQPPALEPKYVPQDIHEEIHDMENDELQDMAPVVAAAPIAPAEPTVQARANISGQANLPAIANGSMSALAAQIIANRESTILVTNAAPTRTDSVVADELLQYLAQNGRTAIVVNAGGPDQLRMAGLTDMCVGDADFGSIIRKGATEEQYYVPWGTKDRLHFSGERFTLMMDALSEIYDHVIVECGRLGLSAPLAPFADLDPALLLVTNTSDQEQLEALMGDVRALGIRNITCIEQSKIHTNVA